VSALIVSGCSSAGSGQPVSVGPNFPSQTLYATNTSQNGVGIYPSGATSGGPQYQIGGSLTGFTGPQYLAFDSSSNLYVTNYSSSLGTGEVVEIKALATGNVQYYAISSLGPAHPRGIADFQTKLFGATTATDALAIGVVDPTQSLSFASQLQIWQTAVLGSFNTIAGPATGLNVPSGVAVDSKNNIYVSNLQGASVTVYALPSPSPTPSPSPSPTATPTASPSPTPTPVGATPSPSPTSSPTPTPVPTATPNNYAPVATITGAATGIGQPTGIALDSAGNIYVSDQASTICQPTLAKCPAVLVFAAGSNGNVAPKAIVGAATLLLAPTDVKVDNTGQIYVADSTSTGAGVIYVFASGATGNVAPKATLTSPGAVLGIGLAP
jgi:hypothetical protein